MKPCYSYGGELLVLAELLKDGQCHWQSCKARISQGTPPSITMVKKEFAARAGWLTLPGGGALHQERPVVLHCKLRVGSCEVNTDVYVVDKMPTPEQRIPFDWHLHLGDPVLKTLCSASWDANICYLECLYMEGSPTTLEDAPSCCNSFTDALGIGHEDCMRYWHGKPIVSPASNSQGDDRPSWWSKHLELHMQQRRSWEEAARQPTAEAMMYLHDVRGMAWDEYTCADAARAGSINCLSYAHCSGCPWNADVCSSAAMAGRMACLMYAHEHGCEWDRQTCSISAGMGHLDCLVYAHKHGCEWDEWTCRRAARKGNLEILKFAHENGCPWDAETCAVAAIVGSMECLVYAHEQGCPWDDRVCQAAAEDGNLQILRYAHEQGCPWTERTLLGAAETGNLSCLMYAHKHGCPNDPAAVQESSHSYMDGLAFAATGLPCLQYVHEKMGCMWDPEGSEWKNALRWGRCDVLKYIHQHGGANWKRIELFCMWESLEHGDSDELLDGKARCVLYMHRYGGCTLFPLKGTKVGERMAAMRDRSTAVLLGFRAAGRARADSRSPNAAHAAMAMVPSDLLNQIICTANLNAV